MKRFLLTLALALMTLVVPLQAQNKQLKLAVYTTEGTGNVSETIKNIARQEVSTGLVRTGKYVMAERSGEFLKVISQEQQYQREGMVSDGEIAELGEQYGANCVCAIDITLEGNYFYVALRMVDVAAAVARTGGSSYNADYRGVQDVVPVITKAIEEMEGISSEAVSQYNSGNSYSRGGNGQNYTESAFGINMKMVYVEGGSYNMGCTGEQGGDCDDDEKTVRYVTVSDFYIGQFEITQAQWQAVMGTSVYQQRDKANTSWPMYGTGNDYPMYYVSWEEAKEFCRRLSQQTGKTYRLPTEAEWEYAARGGKKTQNTKYAGGYSLDYVGWYTSNSGGKTHAVGTKNANELGIYDMSGNVWEWCEDWYGDYRSYDTDNPTGPSSGSYRVIRGGGWSNSASSCRVSNRDYDSPGNRYYDLGFRVVCLP